MKTISLISVGKLKEKAYLQVESDYLKRLSTFKVKIFEEKSYKEDLELEAKGVLKRVQEIRSKGSASLFLFTEKGKSFNSNEFSKWLFNKFQNSNNIIFVIGGASGHGSELYKIADGEVSLSPLTFPHHMTRAIIAEQFYRAETIYQGHPYSK